MNKTIDYYNENAADFCSSTKKADMHSIYNMFEKYLFEGARILDCGCGSGRDTKYFLEQDYDVEAIDGSEELCKYASDFTGIDVKNIYFQEICYENEFDAIWACASLLHLKKSELPDVFERLTKALVPGGIIYVSFKYGNKSRYRHGRFFTDLDEVGLEELCGQINELKIIETYTTGDVREGREDEIWLNAILQKPYSENQIQNIENRFIIPKIESSIDKYGNKRLVVNASKARNEVAGVLNNLGNILNFKNIVNNISREEKYVVQIPYEYMEQFKSGEVFINRNKTTGVEWPTLMKKADNGRYRFVDNLPIKRESFVQGNPFQDVCFTCNNIYMQMQMKQIAEKLEQILDSVKKIEKGQENDRYGLIEAGRSQILIGLACDDPDVQKSYIVNGVQSLLTGKKQVEKAIQYEIDRFRKIPDSSLLRFGISVVRPGYLNKKDDDYNHIDEMFEYYKLATNMIALGHVMLDEKKAIELTYEDSINFYKSLDLESIRSIEKIHENSDLFFNSMEEIFKREEKLCLKKADNYDFITIEIDGDKLLEVIDND